MKVKNFQPKSGKSKKFSTKLLESEKFFSKFSYFSWLKVKKISTKLLKVKNKKYFTKFSYSDLKVKPKSDPKSSPSPSSKK